MDKIKAYILRHPIRVKYGLIVIDIFAILIAVRMYINYTTIEDTIQNTITQSEDKRLELAFSENFLLNYEKSQYAQFFLQHENSILWEWEYIIKFEKMPEKKAIEEQAISKYDTKEYIKSPQESRNYFIVDKISKIE